MTTAAADRKCGSTVVDGDGEEGPCDRPAPEWRWYQGHNHEDTLDVACPTHANEGGRRMAAATAVATRMTTAATRVRDPGAGVDLALAAVLEQYAEQLLEALNPPTR